MTKDWRDPIIPGTITAFKTEDSPILLQRKTFLDRAFDQSLLTAQSSRDPSTKVGAAIYRPDNTLASAGYNGFPRGVRDLPERYADRPTKYLFVVHAELNAILTAREPLHGYSLYSTLFPCAACAGAIIQAGIKQVYCPQPSKEEIERWGQSFEVAKTMFDEAMVGVRTEAGLLVTFRDAECEDDPASILQEEPAQTLPERFLRWWQQKSAGL